MMLFPLASCSRKKIRSPSLNMGAVLMLPSCVSFLSPETSGAPAGGRGFHTATAPNKMTAASAPTARAVTSCDGLVVEPTTTSDGDVDSTATGGSSSSVDEINR